MAKQSLTMAQLRARLYKAIDDVATGDLDPNRANAIAKLAAQMNQSLMTEVEIARLNILRKVDAHFEIGSLPVADEVLEETPKTIDVAPTSKSAHQFTPTRDAAPKALVRRDVAPALMGDPAPGRSALDQRKGAP